MSTCESCKKLFSVFFTGSENLPKKHWSWNSSILLGTEELSSVPPTRVNTPHALILMVNNVDFNMQEVSFSNFKLGYIIYALYTIITLYIVTLLCNCMVRKLTTRKEMNKLT